MCHLERPRRSIDRTTVTITGSQFTVEESSSQVLDVFKKATRVTEAFSAEYFSTHGVVPIEAAGDSVLIATWHEAIPPQVCDDLEIELGRTLRAVLLPEPDIRATIQRLYAMPSMTAASYVADLSRIEGARSEVVVALEDLRSRANEPPVVMLVNLLLLDALDAGASDVHLESTLQGLRVAYRIDGILHDAATPPADMRDAVVSRLKIMAELDIAERRLPQDGRIRLQLRNRQVDVRVSTVPTLHGESVVLRLLDQSALASVELAALGMRADILDGFLHAVTSSAGLVLVTGPTGSGKTTTLYAALRRIASGSQKIITIEDPVEYTVPGICQVPVRSRVGLTFAAGLRAILRQDPDVVMVGEIRDRETAEVATHAALTGHLVLATLHTNDAPGAVARLLDLGVEDYLVASTLRAVLAQRLVRRICDACACMVAAVPEHARQLGITGAQQVRRGAGCETCRMTGYAGRTGIYELLLPDERMRSLIRNAGADGLAVHLTETNWRNLRSDGLERVAMGETTPAEILRVTMS